MPVQTHVRSAVGQEFVEEAAQAGIDVVDAVVDDHGPVVVAASEGTVEALGERVRPSHATTSGLGARSKL